MRSPSAIVVGASSAAAVATEAGNALDHRQQIYARQIFGQLRLLRLCARRQADELERSPCNTFHRPDVACFTASAQTCVAMRMMPPTMNTTELPTIQTMFALRPVT
jgi:hypothetical protein